MFGIGKIVAVDDEYVTVAFPNKGTTKQFLTMMSFAGDCLTADVADMPNKISMYKDIIYAEKFIKSALEKATAEFAEYKEYLE